MLHQCTYLFTHHIPHLSQWPSWTLIFFAYPLPPPHTHILIPCQEQLMPPIYFPLTLCQSPNPNTPHPKRVPDWCHTSLTNSESLLLAVLMPHDWLLSFLLKGHFKHSREVRRAFHYPTPNVVLRLVTWTNCPYQHYRRSYSYSMIVVGFLSKYKIKRYFKSSDLHGDYFFVMPNQICACVSTMSVSRLRVTHSRTQTLQSHVDEVWILWCDASEILLNHVDLMPSQSCQSYPNFVDNDCPSKSLFALLSCSLNFFSFFFSISLMYLLLNVFCN